MNATTNQVSPPTDRTWWSRHWKWATPLLAFVILLVAGLVWAWPILSLRFHSQYAAALNEIRNSPAVAEKLGQPIEPVRVFPGGSVSTAGDRSEATFYFQVAGPKGQADVSARSRQMQGQWSFAQLELTFADRQRVDLSSAIHEREGNDMPKFDPNAPQPEVKAPDLPVDIQLPDLPEEARK